ncbi:MAG: hypothetical protein ACM3UU_04965 [Ignavibacteriales bacterium]
MKVGTGYFETRMNLSSNTDKPNNGVNYSPDIIQKNDPSIRMEKSLGVTECKTCSQRKYMDKSNDASVSFQAPTHVDPNLAGSKVMSHEQEHVVNEQAKAQEEGREVVSQTVQIFTDVCPECGKRYVSGGNTKTVTKAKSNNSIEKELNNKYFGEKIDVKV